LGLIGIILFTSCDTTSNSDVGSSSGASGSSGGEWLIPVQEVVDGGPGKDGIPSIDDPTFQTVTEASYVQDDRLVIGIKIGEDVR
jgi:hypothetical protein